MEVPVEVWLQASAMQMFLMGNREAVGCEEHNEENAKRKKNWEIKREKGKQY